MRAIMYHYVRRYDKTLPYFRYLDVDNFRKQLDYFEAEFGYVSFDEWCDFVNNGKVPEKTGKVVLTFDDAMRCHYEYVFPELIRRGLWGIFYVPTTPYADRIVLDVHRIHLLCGAFPGIELLRIANSFVSEAIIPDEKIEEFRNETYKRQQNTVGVSEFKRLMNYYIDYKYRTAVIDKVADDLGFSFKRDEFYVPKEQLLEMKQKGMVIGSHSHSHPVMSKLSAFAQQNEIEKSFSILGDLVETNHKTYCHPYGGFHSFNKDTVDVLDRLGVSYSFNVESREIDKSDYNLSKYHLPRFDCNFFPHGKAS
jgi:peptidoglycan/xylan/chitin deacetylase (PgdA/CDA1 family)